MKLTNVIVTHACLLSLVSCHYIRGEKRPPLQLTAEERAELNEARDEIHRWDDERMAALEAEQERAHAAREEAKRREQESFNETLAGIAAAERSASKTREKSGVTKNEIDALGCHRQVFRASKLESEDRAEGRNPRSKNSAAAARRAEAITCLKEHPEAINGLNGVGWAPIHIAASYGGVLMLEALIETFSKKHRSREEVDLCKPAGDGLRATDYALMTDHPNVAEVLQREDIPSVDWSCAQPIREKTTVTSAGSPFKILWAGEPVCMRNADGDHHAPRDLSKVELTIAITWSSKDSEYRCSDQYAKLLFSRVKDAPRISLAMRPCLGARDELQCAREFSFHASDRCNERGCP